ncbi:DeoR/GlpR family DNA-binding transcription regulator [Limnohabitans sp. MORI2]|uniref:DeoR/GlpR family DNA-binding transcription regulator n=1 Tax=Limnohabitans sp. MORI2 TaxID=1751150 RepID=UPI0024908A1A|nr:DeoR/GlpR family DNA-binding transcription regulator [Limnohabitans sp. MORI2]
MTRALNPRQLALLQAVREHGALKTEAIAVQLGTTLQTVRRDIQRLSEAGALERFHGGVRVLDSITRNTAYVERQRTNAQAKQRIARSVAAAIPPGASLFMNIGTTVEAVAAELIHHRDLRVVTNNLHVAKILAVNPNCEVVVAGGAVRSEDLGVVGEAALSFIRQFKVDFGLIGISGIDADGSLRDFDMREVMVARAIVANSRQVCLVADASKFGRTAMIEMAPIHVVHTLYTDARPGPEFEGLLHEQNVNCVIAPD